MEYYNKEFCLEVWGDYACFTRPEMKVERVSYDVITPSAARGIFEAILWKPAILWEIRRIEVLAPIRWESVRRNEVEKVASERSSGIFVEDDRQLVHDGDVDPGGASVTARGHRGHSGRRADLRDARGDAGLARIRRDYGLH